MIDRDGNIWRIRGGGLTLRLDAATGCPAAIELDGCERPRFEHAAEVLVRDDRLRREFDSRDLDGVEIRRRGESLQVLRRFRGASWTLRESYRAEDDALRWEGEVALDRGAFRSCSVALRLPLPLPIYPLKGWAAGEGMPTQVARHAELAMEYGDINSGVVLPAVCLYVEKQAGLLLAMPFDFRAPLLRFKTSYREEYLEARFDWMALRPGRPARTALLLRATPGDWRPALGWMHRRFPAHFRPRSRAVARLWGGVMAERPRIVAPEEARLMARLGLRWFEVHEHFPGYGQYHPEGEEQWINKDYAFQNDPPVSPAVVRACIRNLHAVKVAAMPYIQVTGDGDNERVAPVFPEAVMRDLRGRPFSSWVHTTMMNGDPSLPFGRDITRQIRGLLSRYPECDGVMAEGNKWACEKFQYYCLEKPLYFYHWTKSDRDTEFMLQTALLYGAGQCTNRPARRTWETLYARYLPLLARLRRRRWIYDPDPFALPEGFDGAIYRGAKGTVLLSVVANLSRVPGRRLPPVTARVRTRRAARATRATLQLPGGDIRPVAFGREKDAIQFDLPGGTAAALVEIEGI